MNRYNPGARFHPERQAEIAATVKRISETKRDYVLDRSAMQLVSADNELTLKVDVPANGEPAHTELLSLRRKALTQLAGTLKLPVRYLDRLVEAGHHDLVAHQVSELLRREPKRHLLRTVDGRARALLSDSYRCVDNFDLLTVALQEFKALGVDVWDLRHSDDGDSFRVLGVAPAITDVIRDDRPGDHRVRRFGDDGNVVHPMISISNSETGGGRILAQPSLLEAYCANGYVVAKGFARVHVGRKAEDVGELFYSDQTKRLAGDLIVSQIRDLIRKTFDADAFKAIIAQANDATQRMIEDKPTERIDAAVGKLGIHPEHRDALLEEFFSGGDKSQKGLAAAITALANPERRGDMADDLVSELEEIGGQVLMADAKEFQSLIAV